MDAYYLSDLLDGYTKKIKSLFGFKNIIILLAGGAVMSMVLAVLLNLLSTFISLPGPFTVSVLSFIIVLVVSALLFDRDNFICGLLDRAPYLLKNKIHYSGYIIIAAIALVALLLCVLGCPVFVLSIGALFMLMPSVVSGFSSAAFNSASRALGYDLRIGSEHLDMLLFGAGAASLIFSLVTIVIGGLI